MSLAKNLTNGYIDLQDENSVLRLQVFLKNKNKEALTLLKKQRQMDNVKDMDSRCLEFCQEIVECTEELYDLKELIPVVIRKEFETLRRILRDLHCLRHHYSSANCIEGTDGWTEDVVIFLCISQITLLLDSEKVLVYNFKFPVLVCDDTLPVDSYNEHQVLLSFAALFVHRRTLCVTCDTKCLDQDLIQYVSSLSLRAEILASQETSNKAKLSCAVARTKNSLLYEKSLVVSEIYCLGVHGVQFKGLSHDLEKKEMALLQWICNEIKSWDGPRLRSALSFANRRRDTRPEEAGEICAYGSSTPLRRAKGSMEAVEDLYQAVDLQQVVLVPAAFRVGHMALFRELLLLKLFSNTLESHSCNFMEVHLILDSIRDSHKAPAVSTVSKIKEYFTGWVFVQEDGQTSAVDTLEHIFLIWYNHHFNQKDPLGIFTCQVE